jgi:hypothetical protein
MIEQFREDGILLVVEGNSSAVITVLQVLHGRDADVPQLSMNLQDSARDAASPNPSKIGRPSDSIFAGASYSAQLDW